MRKTKIVKLAKVIGILISISITLGFAGIAIHKIIELQEQLENSSNTIEDFKNKEEDSKNNIKNLEQENKKLMEEKENLQKQNETLNSQLQAKQEQKRQEQQKAKIASSTTISGTCQSWMQQAGITDFSNAYSIFQRESNCSPTARNKSSGAYGVCQALPGSKMASAGADWETNPITQMKWCQSYANSRYGSWSKAVAFWNVNRWW